MDNVEKADVTIINNKKVITVSTKQNLLMALKGHGLKIKSSCGGHATCSDCIVKVVSGIENLNSPSFEEKRLLGNVFHITKERLACQTKITGPVSIDIRDHLAD